VADLLDVCDHHIIVRPALLQRPLEFELRESQQWVHPADMPRAEALDVDLARFVEVLLGLRQVLFNHINIFNKKQNDEFALASRYTEIVVRTPCSR
jgi:hypothetical protein